MNTQLILVLVLVGFLGLHGTEQLQVLQRLGQWHGLNYCDVEWLALETTRYHSVILEVAPK